VKKRLHNKVQPRSGSCERVGIKAIDDVQAGTCKEFRSLEKVISMATEAVRWVSHLVSHIVQVRKDLEHLLGNFEIESDS